MRNFQGIDPGLNGALALLSLDANDVVTDLVVWDMPTVAHVVGKQTRPRLDLQALNTLQSAISFAGITRAAIEDLSGRPSTIKIKGKTVVQKGQWEQGWNCCAPVVATINAGIPYEMARPAIWKKALGVPANKDGARAAAIREFPAFAHLFSRVKDDGRAEAALLAKYASRQSNDG